MKTFIIKFLLLLGVVSYASYIPIASAQNPNVKFLNIQNPQFNSGVQIGDVLQRHIELEINQPYTLAKTDLPAKGRSADGIELKDITLVATKAGDKNRYSINLTYQVFAAASKPARMQFPKETLKFNANANHLAAEIPAWPFWYAALVPENVENAKKLMYPQHQPEVLNISSHQTRLGAFLAMLALGLLGLFYINADGHWLPLMNGAFAQAHRRIRKAPKSLDGLKEASIYIHQAFNKKHGTNLFADDIGSFIHKNPNFSKLKDEIYAFFEQSNSLLFANSAMYSEQHFGNLLKLSKRLRDCERGA
ncbi:nonribosomal peptide synthetase MxaA [Methylotenera sp.]|uniref:nonribosomal peptide synthetase MxaA n=1 Tax=Methylotenera sp. TaxID=2051956 RepID=UPI002EDB67BD